MIQTILRREYLVTCDGCGLATPAKESTEKAYQWVQTQGWQSVTAPCGFAFLTTWLCPTCQRQREAS